MTPSQQWHRLAQATALSVRLAKTVDWLKQWTLWIGGLLLVAGLVVRWFGGGWPLAVALPVWGGSLLAAAAVYAWVRFRKEGLPVAEGLARLDVVLGCNNALSAAAAGCGRWPEVPATPVGNRLRVSWKQIIPPFLLSLVLAFSGALLPLPMRDINGAKIPPPRSHGEIESVLARLEQSGAFDQKQIEELKKELDKLRQQPPAEWYSHANMEAADHLQAGMLDQVRSLASNLNKAASDLEALQKSEASQNPADQQQAAANFKSALEKIKSAHPGLNQKLKESLSKIDPSALKSLSGQDLTDALEQMKQAASTCKNCSGNNPGENGDGNGNSDAQNELDRMLGGDQGNGHGQRDGKNGGEGEGEDTGRGGVARGPGVAPLPLSGSRSELGTSNPEALQNPDLRRTGLGDALGSTDTEHQLDKTSPGIQAAGSAVSGTGGESVTHEALLPAEKALLKGVFR